MIDELLSIHFHLDADEVDLKQRAQRGEKGRDAVAEVALELLAYPHEVHVCAHAARVEEDAAVHHPHIYLAHARLGCDAKGVGGIGPDSQIAREVVERATG